MSLKRIMPDVYSLMRQVENTINPLMSFRMPARLPSVNLMEPLADIRETATNYIIKAEMPGVKQSDIKFDHPDEHTMVIRAEVKDLADDSDVSHVSKERFYGHMERILRLPQALNVTNAQASLSDGILTISVPKMESKHSHVEIAWKPALKELDKERESGGKSNENVKE